MHSILWLGAGGGALDSILTSTYIYIPVLPKIFPVSWMLMHQGFAARMPTAHTKRSNIAFPSPFTYAAMLVWRPTQSLST